MSETEVLGAEEVVISVDLMGAPEEWLRSAALDLKHRWHDKWVKVGYMERIPLSIIAREPVEGTIETRVIVTKPSGVVRITPGTKLELVHKGARP